MALKPRTVGLLAALFSVLLTALLYRLSRPTTPDARPVSIEPMPAQSAVPAASFTPSSAGQASPVAGLKRPVDVVLGEFTAWTERLVNASTTERTQLLATGEALARERRAALKELIEADPQRALELAIPNAVRERLPANISGWLEERVSGRGNFGVLVADDFERKKSETLREVEIGGRRWRAFVYGKRLNQVTTPNAPVNGIAIDDVMAVHEDAVRPLSPDEAAKVKPDGAALCPVSGQPSTINGAEALGEVAGKIERFCGAWHLAAYNQQLTANAGGPVGGGPVGGDTTQELWSQGGKKLLFMRVMFPDEMIEPMTEAAAYAMMDTVNSWYVENSYNSTAIITTVTPLLVLPQTKGWYQTNGDGYILTDARVAADAAGYDNASYDFDVVRFTSVPGFAYSGKAYVHGKGCWMQSSSAGVQCHESGHNYGIWHANFWSATGDGVIGPGTHVEYGDSFDTMGSASAGTYQFNAMHKYLLDWLPNSFVTTVTNSGTYRIRAFDVPSLISGERYALKLRRDFQKDYWVQMRQKFTANVWMRNGVELHWDPWALSASGTHLLDTTPGTPTGNSSKDDASVVVGRTWSDVPAGIHFTPVATGSYGSNLWIDVTINFGTFTSNHAPSLAISPSTLNVAAGGTINFTATASDPDGDALAYYWDFGDLTFGPNSAGASKTFTTAGEYTVRCTVSDMKGGISSASVTVRVGSPVVFRATGRVLDTAGNPLQSVRVDNGSTSSSTYRGAYTDSVGKFTIANLASNAVISNAATRFGYTIVPNGWTNPVTFTANVSNLDFIATPKPVVSLEVTDAICTEAGTNVGVVTMRRSGPTDAPLAVGFFRSGTATFGSDYTNSPAATNFGTTNFVNIPAGQSSLDLVIVPINDSTVEGPETVNITINENTTNYVVGSQVEATLTIVDNETLTKPSVSVSSTASGADDAAPESGPDSGVFIFTRSGGGVGTNLTVFYTVSGTATPGVDYVTLPGSVVIPAGSLTAEVIFRTIDDSLIEGDETVVVALTTNAAYTATTNLATVTIADDDPPTVTISATDNVMAEPSDGATFRVQRSGSLDFNLLVYYALGGTATPVADYTGGSGVVMIPAGAASASFTLTPVNDALVESNETVTVTLLGTSVYNVGTPGAQTVILQDNEIPTVTVTNIANAAESSTAGSFRFTRTLTNGDLTVFFSVGGTAYEGGDYLPLGNSIVIPNGASNATLSVIPIDDTFVENTETVVVQLQPDPAYNVGNFNGVSINLTDDDPLTNALAVGFISSASSQSESSTTVRLGVRMSKAPTNIVTVDYAVTGGTATGGGTDYTLSSGRLTFPSNATAVNLTFTLNNDSLVESNETIIITLSNPTNAVLDAFSEHTLTILDDDANTVTVTSTVTNAYEAGSVPANFRISRAGDTNSDLLVLFEINGTASAPSDYAALGTSVVIPAGSNFVDLPVVPVDDNTPEPTETVILRLTSAAGAKLGAPNIATNRIIDNGAALALPIVTVTATDDTAVENSAETGTFTFSRLGDVSTNLTVYFTVSGLATSGTDFTSIGTNVTFTAGNSNATLTVNPINDATPETNETVVVTLTQRDGYFVGSPASATVTILDDEQRVSITATTPWASETGLVPGAFTISRTGALTNNITVNFLITGTASNGVDYAVLATNAIIPIGLGSVVIPIVPLPDTLAEGTESVILTLVSNAGYTVGLNSNATVLIADRPWDTWRFFEFSGGALTNGSVVGPLADPDGDGLPNLLEYALNRDPMTAESAPPCTVALEFNSTDGETYLVLTFTRRLAPTDVSYTVEVSDDLSSWKSGPAYTEELSATDDGDGLTETVRVRVKAPLSATSSQCVHLRVELQ